MLNDKKSSPSYQKIEACRRQLLADKRMLVLEDFGAGSVWGHQKERRVDTIARNALKSKKLGQLLFRIARYYQPAVMIELGTSLGITAQYLAMGHPAGRLISLEGAAAVASIAGNNFASMGISNAEIVIGNFDDTLAAALDQVKDLQLAFIDGNHRKEPTLRYFEQLLQKSKPPAVLIFDDIHWSADMENAWQEIKDHPQTMLTVDLFFMGLVFLSNDFKAKQHFVIRF